MWKKLPKIQRMLLPAIEGGKCKTVKREEMK
jgi:hypothetical protein